MLAAALGRFQLLHASAAQLMVAVHATNGMHAGPAACWWVIALAGPLPPWLLSIPPLTPTRSLTARPHHYQVEAERIQQQIDQMSRVPGLGKQLVQYTGGVSIAYVRPAAAVALGCGCGWAGPSVGGLAMLQADLGWNCSSALHTLCACRLGWPAPPLLCCAAAPC